MIRIIQSQCMKAPLTYNLGESHERGAGVLASHPLHTHDPVAVYCSTYILYAILAPCWVAGVPGAPAQACISRRQLAME